MDSCGWEHAVCAFKVCRLADHRPGRRRVQAGRLPRPGLGGTTQLAGHKAACLQAACALSNPPSTPEASHRPTCPCWSSWWTAGQFREASGLHVECLIKAGVKPASQPGRQALRHCSTNVAGGHRHAGGLCHPAGAAMSGGVQGPRTTAAKAVSHSNTAPQQGLSSTGRPRSRVASPQNPTHRNSHPCCTNPPPTHPPPQNPSPTHPPPSACRLRSWHRPSSAPRRWSSRRRCRRHTAWRPQPCRQPAEFKARECNGRRRQGSGGAAGVPADAAAYRVRHHLPCSVMGLPLARRMQGIPYRALTHSRHQPSPSPSLEGRTCWPARSAAPLVKPSVDLTESQVRLSTLPLHWEEGMGHAV